MLFRSKSIAHLEATLDPETAQCRYVVERSAPRNLVNMAGVAHAVLVRKLVEIRLRMQQDHTGRRRGLALRDSALLEQRNVDARRGERVCGGTPDRATADNRDVGLKVSAVPRIRRPPRGGNPINPIDSTVPRGPQGGNILVDGRWSHPVAPIAPIAPDCAHLQEAFPCAESPNGIRPSIRRYGSRDDTG